jgi:hypothetical protein
MNLFPRAGWHKALLYLTRVGVACDGLWNTAKGKATVFFTADRRPPGKDFG